MKQFILSAMIGIVLCFVFFFPPSKHKVLIPASSASSGSAPGPTPALGPTLKKPHIHVDGIVPTAITLGQPLNAKLVMTNNGDNDADVVAAASLFIQEVYGDPAKQRKFEDALFKREAQKTPEYSSPVMHTIPPKARQELPISQPWNAAWDNLDPNRTYAVYYMGRFKYRSHADHKFDRTSEFCKHYGLDGKTVVKCYEHNLEPN